jgi:hypothetical protein
MARLLALLLTAGLSPDAQVVQGKPAGVVVGELHQYIAALGSAHDALSAGNWGAAIADAERASDLAPSTGVADYYLACAMNQVGRAEDADGHLRVAVKQGVLSSAALAADPLLEGLDLDAMEALLTDNMKGGRLGQRTDLFSRLLDGARRAVAIEAYGERVFVKLAPGELYLLSGDAPLKVRGCNAERIICGGRGDAGELLVLLSDGRILVGGEQGGGMRPKGKVPLDVVSDGVGALWGSGRMYVWSRSGRVVAYDSNCAEVARREFEEELKGEAISVGVGRSAWVKEGRVLAVASEIGGGVFLLDLDAGSVQRIEDRRIAGDAVLAAEPNGLTVLYVALKGGAVGVLNTESRSIEGVMGCEDPLKIHVEDHRLKSLCLEPDGECIAFTTGERQMLCVYDRFSKDGLFTEILVGAHPGSAKVAFAAKARTLVVCPSLGKAMKLKGLDGEWWTQRLPYSGSDVLLAGGLLVALDDAGGLYWHDETGVGMYRQVFASDGSCVIISACGRIAGGALGVVELAGLNSAQGEVLRGYDPRGFGLEVGVEVH